MTAVPVKVTGFTHTPSHYPWNVLWLAERVFAADAAPVHEVSLWDPEPQGKPNRCEVTLERPLPDERSHPNEIRVVVAALKDGGFHPWVGYVEDPVAVVYADRMDGGWLPAEAWVGAVRVKSPTEFNWPGLRIYIEWGDEPQTNRRTA